MTNNQWIHVAFTWSNQNQVQLYQGIIIDALKLNNGYADSMTVTLEMYRRNIKCVDEFDVYSHEDDDGLFPPALPAPSSSLSTPLNSDRTMTTTTTAKTISTNSFGFTSPKLSSPQSSCNICKRLLYTFEEILVCRACHDSYHWRCVKPETVSHYGENAHFICDKCNDSIITTTPPSSTHRLSNGGIKIKSSDTSERDYRDFVHIPSKMNAAPTKDTTVVSAIRYFEEKQQQQPPPPPQTQKISKQVEYDGNLSTQTNGQHTDDNKITRRLQQQQQQQQQQQNGIESDEENATSGVFQANYQYTPLKEYAAMRSGRTINDNNNTNGYQKSPSVDTDRQSPTRYSGGLRYTVNGYEPTKTRSGESPLNHSTIDNRPQHYTNTTNVNVNGTLSYRQEQQNNQKNSLNHSTPHLSQIRDDGSSTLKSLSQQQQTDRHSIVGSDSGIVMVHQRPTVDENQLIEKKLTDLVQKLGRQLETDSQKLSDKLELKLKNLENMIHQQTYIIRRQDEVIERLKSKISKIETERDHFRERLSIHEQREQDEKKTLTTTETEGSINTNDRNVFEQDDQQQTFNDISTNRKFSNTSSVMTDHSKPSSKKTPAPRANNHVSLHNNQTESTTAKLIKSFPSNPERLVSASSVPSIANKLASSVPLVENPAAASRLDNMIHQSNPKEVNDSSNRNVAQVRQFGRNQVVGPVLMEPQQIITSIHHDDIQIEERKPPDTIPRRSASSSSSSTSSASTSVRADTYDLIAANNVTLAARNSNLHRSLESIPRKTSEMDQGLKATNKTTSLEFGKKPVQYDYPASIYVTPQEVNHPASQYEDVIKGWLRKQNRDSFLKRVERFYCVLINNNLLMHRHEYDRLPHKAINLRGAKVLYYDDQKFGPSLELTWTKRINDPKHYHLYAPNPQEARQWVTGIQTAIQNLESNNKWQRYRMNA